MIRTKDVLMDVRAQMSMDIYEQIPPELRTQMEIKTVEPVNYDYSSNPHWVAAKEKSDKAYKELKTIEFHIRNK